MNKIGIYTNLSKDPGLTITGHIIRALENRGVQPVLMHETAEVLGVSGVDNDVFFAESDIIITAGGDGTVLRIASDIMLNQIPVLSINLGRIGFLTEVEVTDIDTAITRLLKGEYFIEKRMMLETLAGDMKKYALNEMVVQRYHHCRMVRFVIKVNGVEADCFSADGVIVSSPTGSTAYSLSAGGPVLSPNIEALVITPICAHTLHSRPIVAASGDIITVEPTSGESYLMMDGVEVVPMQGKVVVGRAFNDALFIRFDKKNFYTSLKKKLIEWDQA